MHLKSLAVIAATSIAYGCSIPEERNQNVEAQRKYDFIKVPIKENEEKFPTYRVGKGVVPTKYELESDRNSIEALNKLAPISGLSEPAQLNARTRNDAMYSYKAFIKEHRKDTVLVRHFRDKYATKLLVEFEYLKTANSKELIFLIEELLLAKTGRYHVIISALEKLRENGDLENHQRLSETAIHDIENSLKLVKIAQSRLPALIKKFKDGKAETQGTLRKDFMIALLEVDDLQELIHKLEGYRSKVVKMKN